METQEVVNNLNRLREVQQQGFEELSNSLSEVASVIEWGFTETVWQLQQQNEILRSIDHTLKTPNETQDNELRIMAEKLRKRGVFKKSEELFLKALDMNPLDYRIYTGLAFTYSEFGWNKLPTTLRSGY
jgi:hypothetical protein